MSRPSAAVSVGGDDVTLPLPRRIAIAVKYVLDTRLARSATIETVVIYHTSAYAHTIRTKSLVATPTEVYSVKASFDKDSAFFKRLQLNLEVPRGRPDFRVEVVKNARSKTFVIPYLGDMQLPAILAEKEDSMLPEDIAQTMRSMVGSGEGGWIDAQSPRMALSDQEFELIQKYVRIRRFEILVRDCIVAAFTETYGTSAMQRITEALGDDAHRVMERVRTNALRYGIEAESVNVATLFENLGFEHYVRIIEDGTIWAKCLASVFRDQPSTAEALKVIRDARNEISHFRDTTYPGLWAGASMYMDVLEGRIKMTDPRFRKLLEMVQAVKKGRS